MSGIFKAYDIRGIYGQELTNAVAYDIGRAYATLTGAKTVVIGRDCRPHSVPLQAALTRGLTEQGANVVDIGLCSTPMNYYANGSLGADGSIMITASHNPAEWNGFKLCRASAVPISGATTYQGADGRNCKLLLCPSATAPVERTYVMNCGFGELKGMETGSSYRNWAMTSFKTESIPRPSYRVNLIDGGSNLENSATNTYTVNWNYHIRYVHGGGMSLYVTESNGDTAPRSMVTNVLFLDGHAASKSLGELYGDRTRYFGRYK